MNTRDHSDISGELSRNLLRQDFSRDRLYETADAGRQIAKVYSMIENAVAVLSDMRTDISYMYSGGFAATLGLEESPGGETTHSIWDIRYGKRQYWKESIRTICATNTFMSSASSTS